MYVCEKGTIFRVSFDPWLKWSGSLQSDKNGGGTDFWHILIRSNRILEFSIKQTFEIIFQFRIRSHFHQVFVLARKSNGIVHRLAVFSPVSLCFRVRVCYKKFTAIYRTSTVCTGKCQLTDGLRASRFVVDENPRCFAAFHERAAREGKTFRSSRLCVQILHIEM